MLYLYGRSRTTMTVKDPIPMWAVSVIGAVLFVLAVLSFVVEIVALTEGAAQP
jgi:TRAP-type C4-dicarboxylate transport system permease small subunit